MKLSASEQRILREIERDLALDRCRPGYRRQPQPVLAAAVALVVAVTAVTIVACGVRSAAILAPVLWGTGCLTLVWAGFGHAIALARSHRAGR